MTQGRYAFLGTRRWLGIIAVVVLISIVCALLGYWQLTRYQSRAEQVNLVETNYDAEPVPMAQLLDSPDAELAPDDEWLPVQVTGRYVGQAMVLPQRGVAGSPADHVVAMFATSDLGGEGDLILVDRGWYRTDSFAEHPRARDLPEGELQVVLRLRTAEAPSPRDLAEGQVHSLNPGQVRARALEQEADDAGLVSGVYGMLASEQQQGSSTLPAELELLPRPPADLGSHLSYAFQWWVFSAGALVGLVILARREAAGMPIERGPQRRTKEGDDEDAQIDAQLDRPHAPSKGA